MDSLNTTAAAPVLDGETAAEHVRNALQILNGRFANHRYVTLSAEEFDATRARLLSALSVLEAPAVVSLGGC